MIREVLNNDLTSSNYGKIKNSLIPTDISITTNNYFKSYYCPTILSTSAINGQTPVSFAVTPNTASEMIFTDINPNINAIKSDITGIFYATVTFSNIPSAPYPETIYFNYKVSNDTSIGQGYKVMSNVNNYCKIPMHIVYSNTTLPYYSGTGSYTDFFNLTANDVNQQNLIGFFDNLTEGPQGHQNIVISCGMGQINCSLYVTFTLCQNYPLI